MKKIILTLCSLLLTTSVNSNSMITSRFKDYKTNYKAMNKELRLIKRELFLINHYDIDGDMKSDVSEYYPIQKINERFMVSPHPLYYNFDLDEDKKYSSFELLEDEEMDGLNGNERWSKRLLDF